MTRRPLQVAAVLVGVALSAGTLVGCRSPREDARLQFTQQLEDEGGLPHDVAVCVVDRFFEERTTDELKEFFDRKGLTDAESAEFKQLGEECSVLATEPIATNP